MYMYYLWVAGSELTQELNKKREQCVTHLVPASISHVWSPMEKTKIGRFSKLFQSFSLYSALYIHDLNHWMVRTALWELGVFSLEEYIRQQILSWGSKPDCLTRPSAQLNIPTRWIILLSQWEQLLTESDSLGLWGLGVAIWIQRQTSKSSPAILWLSTRIRDSLALKNRTALFHALESLCLFEKRKTFCES